MANFNVDVNATISDGSIANAKLADMNEATIKGRGAGAGSGDPQDLTASQARTAMGLGTAATQNSSAFDAAGSASSAQAFAIQRANHTGTQLASTISDFNSAALAAAPAETTTTIGALINGASEKTTPVDADMLGLMDSAASNVLKKLSWASLKTALAAIFAPKYSIVEINYTGGDQTNNSSPAAVQDVHSSTEFTISATGWYEGEYSGNYTAAASATGIGLGVYSGGGLVTSYFSQVVHVDAGTGDKAAQPWSGANNILAAASSRTTSAGGNQFVVKFKIKVTATGTLRLRFINEVAGSAVTITAVRGFLQRNE